MGQLCLILFHLPSVFPFSISFLILSPFIWLIPSLALTLLFSLILFLFLSFPSFSSFHVLFFYFPSICISSLAFIVIIKVLVIFFQRNLLGFKLAVQHCFFLSFSNCFLMQQEHVTRDGIYPRFWTPFLCELAAHVII